LDESTKNATAGGYVTGVLLNNQTFLQGKTIIIENETGNITGIYLTEDNKINEGSASIPGYFKITSKTGSNYNIKVLDENDDLIKTITNITVKQGRYKVNINSNEINYLLKRNETLKIPIVVENLGDLNDTIFIKIKEITNGWNAIIDTEKIILNAKETRYVFLQISPPENDCINSSVTIFAVSENDAGEFDEIKLSFKILAPDLIVKDVKIYNEQENESYYFGEGEIIKIKAVVKNIGNENATNVNVTFYYDYLDEKHLIDYKNYDLIGNYQKYPTVTWDTKNIPVGVHTIFVIVEQENNIEELIKTNNRVSVNIEIFKTSLSEQEKDVLIVEIYYNTHPKIHNEFITLYNPSSEDIDISGWYITKDPVKAKTDQTKIVFPNPTIITSKNYLCVTENASAYTWETGKTPDFEYNVDSGFNIPKMLCKKSFNLGNSGEVVVLKNCYNHTVDVVVFGKIIFNGTGWEGNPIPICRNGILMKRNIDQNGSYIDTNSSSDWLNVRKYGIGQSDFPLIKISFYGTIKTFVSPDSSFEVIVNELRNAKKSIYLNMYEFTNIYLCDELINALIRNVSVNILLEGNPVGGITDEEKIIINRIAKYKGVIRFIKNDINNNIYKRYDFNHGKYLVIDNETVIVESCNWAKSGVPKNPVYGNREWGVVIKNESVADFFLKVFFDDWNIDRCDVYSFEEMGFIIPDVFYVYESYNSGLYEPFFKSETIIENFTCIPVFSPDTSYNAISELIDSANESIYIQQLYIYKNWENEINPFVEKLINKSKKGVDVKVILNYNSYYDETNEKCNETKQYFDEFGIQTKFIYSNWSIFSNIHNKGMIVDNKSVLISSINWNENSFLNNREAGVIIVNEKLARFYADVFFYDWNICPQKQNVHEDIFLSQDYKNIIYIVVIFTFTFVLIIRDWRKRQWT
ncbi:MAG: phospholipase D-like domain-containing protein, partial [Candidatus Thermoplasmatota archaeon]|nr:phospholipase D-like domain-containing protein [Candidatus Thermoplasmatota archaeon]